MNRRELLAGSASAILVAACEQNDVAVGLVQKIESDLPFEVFSAAGSEALNAYEYLNQRYEGRASAVVLGPEVELEYYGDVSIATAFGSTESILDKSNAQQFPSGYRDQLREQMDEILSGLKGDPILESMFSEIAEIGLAADLQTGEWPSDPPDSSETQGMTLTRNWDTGRPHQKILLGVFPTPDRTEIPAYVPFGGWNECPPPEWHVAALRYWREKWGAHLVCLSHDVMEIRVQSRPKSRAEAISLAQEQYDYCSDIVEQGVGDIASLANYLMHSDWWYFWWD